MALNNRADRACDFGQPRGCPGKGRDLEVHRVVVMMLDHEGFFTAFRMPGQRAVGEARRRGRPPRTPRGTAPAAGTSRSQGQGSPLRPAPQSGRRRYLKDRPSCTCHPHTASPPLAKSCWPCPMGTERASWRYPAGRSRRCANLLVGQRGVGQPVTCLDRQQHESHCLIMHYAAKFITRHESGRCVDAPLACLRLDRSGLRGRVRLRCQQPPVPQALYLDREQGRGLAALARCHDRCDDESTRLNIRSAHEAQAHLDVRTAGVWQDHPGEQVG